MAHTVKREKKPSSAREQEQPSLAKVATVFLISALFAAATAGLVAMFQDGMVEKVSKHIETTSNWIHNVTGGMLGAGPITPPEITAEPDTVVASEGLPTTAPESDAGTGVPLPDAPPQQPPLSEPVKTEL